MPPIADAEHVNLLLHGVEEWNRRRPHWANLADADLMNLDLRGANLSNAGMWGVTLIGSDLSDAILDNSDLEHASLARCRMIRTSVNGTKLHGAWVYGAAIWDIKGKPASEDWLGVTPDGSHYFEPDAVQLRVDGLSLAQFMYTMAASARQTTNDAALGKLLDAFSKSNVLLLGRFTEERKVVLDAIRNALLTSRTLFPVVFDFKRPTARDLTETVMFLATSSRLIVADLTDPSSVPHELASIVPTLPSIPVIPLIARESGAYAMFEHLQRYPWVMPIHTYGSVDDVLSALPALVDLALSRVAG